MPRIQKRQSGTWFYNRPDGFEYPQLTFFRIMKIYLMKDGKDAGPFKEKQVWRWVDQGVVSIENLAHAEWSNDWVPLRLILPKRFSVCGCIKDVWETRIYPPLLAWAASPPKFHDGYHF